MTELDQNLRYDWSLDEIEAVYNLPLPELIFRAQTAHRAFHSNDEVQGCQLLSIKTGGCPEDCAYCPQSAHYETDVERVNLLSVEDTLAEARRARDEGATRFCMGAAWRDVPAGQPFEQVLAIKDDLAFNNLSRLADEAHDRERGDALAAT